MKILSSFTHNSQNPETTQIGNRITNFVYSYNGILLGDKKKQTTDAWNNEGKTHTQNLDQLRFWICNQQS